MGLLPDGGVDGFNHILLGIKANQGVWLLIAGGANEQGGDVMNLQCPRNVGVIVHVDAIEIDSAVVLGG